MGATEERRRHPFWQRPKTQSFFRLAWPALGAWFFTALLVVGPEGLDALPELTLECLAYACFLSYMASVPYIFVAAAANGPVKTRILACAANASVICLIMAVLAEDESAKGSAPNWPLFAGVACGVVLVAVALFLWSNAKTSASDSG